jgi:hypothetical protein
MLQSKFDHPRNKIREQAVMQVLDKNRIPYESLVMDPAPTPLSEVLQFTMYAAFVSFYLAIVYEVDPSKIEVVDFLKEKLAEKPME